MKNIGKLPKTDLVKIILPTIERQLNFQLAILLLAHYTIYCWVAVFRPSCTSLKLRYLSMFLVVGIPNKLIKWRRSRRGVLGEKSTFDFEKLILWHEAQEKRLRSIMITSTWLWSAKVNRSMSSAKKTCEMLGILLEVFNPFHAHVSIPLLIHCESLCRHKTNKNNERCSPWRRPHVGLITSISSQFHNNWEVPLLTKLITGLISSVGIPASCRVSMMNAQSVQSYAFSKSSFIIIAPLIPLFCFWECNTSWYMITLSMLCLPWMKLAWLGEMFSFQTD